MASSDGNTAAPSPFTEEYLREDRGHQSTITSIAFVAIASMFIVLRIFTRAVIVRNMGPEDYIIIVSWLLSIALTVCLIFEVRSGQGRHVQALTPANAVGIFKALYVSINVYQPALILTKASILCQYYRIFPGKNIRIAIYTMAGITAAFGIWSTFTFIFMCTPIQAFWNQTLPGGHCINTTAAYFAASGVNILTDVLIFLLPMPALYQLQLPKRQRIGLMVVFALGGFVCLVSILRLRAIHDITVSADPTWDNVPASYWSSVEVNVGLICASLPSLKALATKYMPKLVNSSITRGLTSSNRKTGGVASTNKSMNRHNGMSEVELESKGFADTQSLAPNRIQILTVVEQERESDDSSVSSQGNDTTVRAGSKVQEMA